MIHTYTTSNCDRNGSRQQQHTAGLHSRREQQMTQPTETFCTLLKIISKLIAIRKIKIKHAVDRKQVYNLTGPASNLSNSQQITVLRDLILHYFGHVKL